MPLNSLLDERVLQLWIMQPFGERPTLMNVDAPEPAADKKMFREELLDYKARGACLMAGNINSLLDA